MGNHTNVIDLFGAKRTQRRLGNLFAQLGGTYDNPVVINGRVSFALYAPGAKLDDSLLHTLVVRVTVPSGASYEARINRLQQHDPSRSIYWLRTDALDGILADTKVDPQALRLEILSPCGHHAFEATIPTKRAKNA